MECYFLSLSLFPWHPLWKDFLLIASILTPPTQPLYHRSSYCFIFHTVCLICRVKKCFFIAFSVLHEVHPCTVSHHLSSMALCVSTYSGWRIHPHWVLTVKKDARQTLLLLFTLVLLALQGPQGAPRWAGSGSFLDYWLHRGGRHGELFLLCRKW